MQRASDWIPFMLPTMGLALGCLQAREGSRDDAVRAATCAYQVRCGAIGASNEAACRAADHWGGLPFLDGRGLAQETAGYSTTEAIRAGRLEVDEARLGACVDALTHADCGSADVLACMVAHVARVPAGGACLDDRECRTRICAVAEGDFGPWSGDAGCAGVCVRELARGEPCVGVGGLSCGGDDVCDVANGVCRARGATGETCTGGLLGGDCAGGLFCNEVGRCEALRTEGSPCAAELGLTGGCAAGLRCTEGQCAGPAREGERCDLGTLGGLGEGVGGLGGLGGLLGAACEAGLHCDTALEDAVCRRRVAVGEVCATPWACEDGHACVGLTWSASAAADETRPGRCAPWSDAGRACVTGATVSGCPTDMTCHSARAVCVAREVASVPLGGTCDPSPSAAPADTCAEGGCDATTKVCALRCGAD